jgi:hypothetical protein
VEEGARHEDGKIFAADKTEATASLLTPVMRRHDIETAKKSFSKAKQNSKSRNMSDPNLKCQGYPILSWHDRRLPWAALRGYMMGDRYIIGLEPIG